MLLKALRGPERGRPRWALLATGVALLLAACGLESQPVAPQVRTVGKQPELRLPPDFDLVLRVDVARWRLEVGAELSERALSDGLRAPGAPPQPLLDDAIGHADLMLIGLKLGAAAEAPRTWAVRGHFAGLTPNANEPAARWLPVASEGRAEVFESVPSAPGGERTRLYRLRDELLIVAPSSEGGAIERVLRGGAEPSLWVPPDRGMFSVALNPGSFARVYLGRYPRLAGYIARAHSASGYADPLSDGLHLSLELAFDTPEAAAEAQEVLARLLTQLATSQCVAGIVARAARIEPAARALAIDANIQRAQAAAVYDCVLHGGCCPPSDSTQGSATTPQ